MMKKRTVVCLASTMLLASNTFAGFASLSSLASQVVDSASGTSSSTGMDLASFFQQAKTANQMFLQSRTSLATLFAERKESAELQLKLESLKTTSNLKEKEAIQKEITQLTNAVLDASKKDEAATIEKINALSASQKDQLLKSMTNFTLASLTARELVTNSKGVSMQLLSNPKSLGNSGLSLMDAKGLLGDVTSIAKNSSMALIEYPQLLKKANVSFKVPTSTAEKPQDISNFL